MALASASVLASYVLEPEEFNTRLLMLITVEFRLQFEAKPVPSTNASNSVNAYSNPNQATDKYYDETIVEEHDREQNIQNVENVISLTGEAMDVKSFKHNNMVPFFGSKVTQSSDVKGYEGLLDIYTGSGNNSVKKQGIAPMFKPEAGLTHIYGAPNNSD